MLPGQDVVQEVPVFEAWVSPCCLEPILLLEQGVGDDKLMLRTELQKQVPIVIAVANSMTSYDSFAQFEVSSHSCVKSPDEFVFGVNLLREVMRVAVESLLCSSFSMQSMCIHTEDSGKLVRDWES